MICTVSQIVSLHPSKMINQAYLFILIEVKTKIIILKIPFKVNRMIPGIRKSFRLIFHNCSKIHNLTNFVLRPLTCNLLPMRTIYLVSVFFLGIALIPNIPSGKGNAPMGSPAMDPSLTKIE